LFTQGTVYVTLNGQIKSRPEVEIAQMAADSMRAFGAEFGLSPTSRARIMMPQPTEKADPMEELLSGIERGER
jgi:P27 family predicted phage terminase small subunit